MEFTIRAERRPQGARKLVRERAEYFRLMALGVSSKEACKLVGINYRTGKKWRNGHHSPGAGKKAVPPTTRSVAPPCAPSRYLTEDERVQIADRRRENAGVRQIAAELGRSASTISRELRRNAHPGSGAYRPYAAQRRAEERRPRPKPSKIGANTELRAFIAARLERKWSPQQICQALRQAFPDQPEMHVAHETIYQALYVQGRGELRRELARALRTGRARRRPHRRPDIVSRGSPRPW